MNADAPLWINTGELSGDMHGALLLAALRERDPSLRFVGMGGEHLRQAGMETLFRVEALSVMGITEVLGQITHIIGMLADIKKALTRLRPKAIVVIDAPDFHFRILGMAKKLNIPAYYYISPKVWAWREKRAEFIRDHVRRLISILPFEVEFYRRFGMDIDYVGNPLVDMINAPALDSIPVQPGLLGFLPGSRKKEVSALLPIFGEAARLLLQRIPQLQFAYAKAPGLQEDFLGSLWPNDIPVRVIPPEERWSFMRRCEMLIAASGTVTLESAILGVPALVTYKVSPLSFAAGKLLVKVPFVSLPNLILGRELYPELLQKQCTPQKLAEAALAWLLPKEGDAPLKRIREELGPVRGLLGGPGAAGRAADLILRDLATIS